MRGVSKRKKDFQFNELYMMVLNFKFYESFTFKHFNVWLLKNWTVIFFLFFLFFFYSLMQCLYILLTPGSVQYCVGFFSTLPLFHRTVRHEQGETWTKRDMNKERHKQGETWTKRDMNISLLLAVIKGSWTRKQHLSLRKD